MDKSLIAASTSLFALLVSPISGVMASSLGRKRVIVVSDLLFIIGALLQASAHSVWVMVLGRSIIGLAVGAASFVTPLYIAELAPSMFRGRLVTLNVLFITLGQAVAYMLGWILTGRAEDNGGGDGWRWLVGIGAVPGAVQWAVMMLMPESPRWLVQVGKVVDARRVLRDVYGEKGDREVMVASVLKGIETEVREEGEAKRERRKVKLVRQVAWRVDMADSWGELFGVMGNRRALTIACLLQGLQQLCGFVSLFLKFNSPAMHLFYQSVHALYQ